MTAADEAEALEALAQGRLRWGVVAAAPAGYSGEGSPGHLAFGAPEQEVTHPVVGRYYAWRQCMGGGRSMSVRDSLEGSHDVYLSSDIAGYLLPLGVYGK